MAPDLVGPLLVPVAKDICGDLLVDVDEAFVECRCLKGEDVADLDEQLWWI